MDSVREKALRELRRWAYSQRIDCTFWIRLAGKKRPSWRFFWPHTDQHRGTIWQQIETALTSTEVECSVISRNIGASSDHATVFPWPAPVDLFTAQQPQSESKPVETSRENQPVAQALELSQPPRKANEQCARAILRLLYQTQKRHTAADLAIALENSEQDYPWCQDVVEASATWLRKLGAVDNARDGMGAGYGLCYWQADPCDES